MSFEANWPIKVLIRSSIRGMKMKLTGLQNNNKHAKEIRLKRLTKSWKSFDKVLYYQGLLYVLEIICLELISNHYNNPLAKHFGVKKTQKLIA